VTLQVYLYHRHLDRQRAFLDGQDLFLSHIFMKKFSGRNKILRGTKNFGEIGLECPPWLQAWFRFSGYLAEPTLLDETK